MHPLAILPNCDLISLLRGLTNNSVEHGKNRPQEKMRSALKCCELKIYLNDAGAKAPEKQKNYHSPARNKVAAVFVSLVLTHQQARIGDKIFLKTGHNYCLYAVFPMPKTVLFPII